MENMSGRHSRGVRRLCSEAEGWAGLSLYSRWHLGKVFANTMQEIIEQHKNLLYSIHTIKLKLPYSIYGGPLRSHLATFAGLLAVSRLCACVFHTTHLDVAIISHI